MWPFSKKATKTPVVYQRPLTPCPFCGETHHFGDVCKILKGRHIQAWGGNDAWFESMKDDTTAYFVGNDPERGGFMAEVPLSLLVEELGD